MKRWHVMMAIGVAVFYGTTALAESEGRARPASLGDRTPLITVPVQKEEPAEPKQESEVPERTPEERLKEVERLVTWIVDALDPNRNYDKQWLERRLRDLERQIDGLDQQLRRMEQQLRSIEMRR